ncbi:RluA family pseudouridine synthase [Buchnera aphidicola]|uniref:RluA family pseudouridine synthase n=1 Tax=Buchnera aphidicola TaxID=9 RepID=UPI0030EE4E5B
MKKKIVTLQKVIKKNSYINQRLDKILSKIFPNYSRSCFKKWILKGYVSINGKIVNIPKKKIMLLDKLVVKGRIYTKTFYPEKIFLNIIYEDKYLMIINKPCNMVVHPGYGNENKTLLNGLLFYNNLLKLVPRAGIVHRLDKNTTGLLIIAKTIKTYFLLQKMLKFRKIYREYRAIVNGSLFGSGSIKVPISRHFFNRTKMSVSIFGKLSKTYYTVLENFPYHTLLKIFLKTGRTHQIRVHMLYLNYPILGDPLYKKKLFFNKYLNHKTLNILNNFKRQALHAYKLKFLHPITKKIIKIKSLLPEDMQKIIFYLRNNKQI